MEKELRGVVRLRNNDIYGHYKLKKALTRIKGINYPFAHAVCMVFMKKTGIKPDIQIGYLDDKELELLEDIILDPLKYGIPEYLVNCRNELFTGETKHLTESDIDLYKREIVAYHQKIKTWKGIRYALGLPVRGQRTRTSGRRGKTVGVKRKK